MPEEFQSQWDFGDLFEYARSRKVYTVGELTGKVRRLLEDQFGRVRVRGEVGGLRKQSSGHWYFALKDAAAQIACVMFRADAEANRAVWPHLTEGAEIVVEGDLTVYERRGQYQLLVRKVELCGAGALQAAFEKLKARLQAEGLFDAARKRPIPGKILRVGLATSPSGAAIRDFLQVVTRRFPLLEITFVPCRVQGEGAAREIAAAIEALNRWAKTAPEGRAPEVIVVTRGGGSLEDLWAFNEEPTARAVAASAVPVISAVGHEIDFTLSDFAADLRAPTPSAAAELVTEWGWRAGQFVGTALPRLEELARRRVERLASQAAREAARLARLHPRRRFELREQRLDELRAALRRAAKVPLRGFRARAQFLRHRLERRHPQEALARSEARLRDLRSALLRAAERAFEARRIAFEKRAQRLELLSPETILARGYSITMEAETGRILRVPDQTSAGRRLKTRLAGGLLWSRVERPSNGEETEAESSAD